MAARDVSRARERALIALARRQHGVATAAQLASLGFGRDAIAHRVRQERLTRLHHGVYLVGALASPHTRGMAAVLACGRGAVLSHHDAALLWELPVHGDRAVHVTVLDGSARRRAGLRVHRVGRLGREETGRRNGIAVTAPARTLLDLASVLDESRLERVVEEAEVRKLVSRRALSRALDRAAGRPGAPALRAAVARYETPSLTRSEAERRLLRLVRTARLPAPAANVVLAGHEVDLLWAAERLVVEVDGYAFHSSRRAFERDRRRDAELQAAGYRVVRVTWHQLAREREAVAASLAAALARGAQAAA